MFRDSICRPSGAHFSAPARNPSAHALGYVYVAPPALPRTIALMADPRTVSVDVTRMTGEAQVSGDDLLAIEEPLEIRMAWIHDGELREKVVAVTMRTPGDDFELAAGFMACERILASRNDIESIRHWSSPNVVRVALRSGVALDLGRLDRHFYTTSSCGVCGKTSIDAIAVDTPAVESGLRVSTTVIHALPAALEARQAAFRATGGIHAAAIFDAAGELLELREDVGRHNAVDKVLGAFFLGDVSPLREAVLMVSGRASFELVQKAAVAGVPFLAAVGAPSSLARDLAEDLGITLLGFVRNERFNVYSHGERIR
jgi:FdhD protein